MIIGGVDLEVDMKVKWEQYIKDIETRNKVKIPEEQKVQALNIFNEGYLSCLKTILATQKQVK